MVNLAIAPARPSAIAAVTKAAWQRPPLGLSSRGKHGSAVLFGYERPSLDLPHSFSRRSAGELADGDGTNDDVCANVMTVYVDLSHDYGWIVLGERTRSCHMFSDSVDLTELHDLAGKIGMRRAWFQDKVTAPHYDLRPEYRDAALREGAVAVDRRTAARIWRARRDQLRGADDR